MRVRRRRSRKIESVESNKEKAQGVIMVGYRGVDMFSKDRYALELIDEASSDLGSRFFVRIREKMGLAYYVGASQMQGLVPGLFAFYLGTDPQKIEPVKTALLDEIRKLASDGLTDRRTDAGEEKTDRPTANRRCRATIRSATSARSMSFTGSDSITTRSSNRK